MSLAVRVPSLMFLLRSTLSLIRRFPATSLAAVLGTIALLVLIDGPTEEEVWVKLFMVAALGLPWFTAATALSEARSWDSARHYGLLAGLAGLLCLYYWQLDISVHHAEMTVIPRYFGFLLIGHLAAAVAPYVRFGSVSDFWEYNKELFSAFIVGAVFTFIIWVGLSLAVLAVKELFNFDFSEKVYLRLFAVLAGLFHTAYFLHHYPDHFAFTEKEISYTVVFKNLCKYILLPIVVLYFLILYAYSAKILLSWSLPRGWVGSLVLGFSIAGIFAYLINFLLPKYDQSPIVVNFYKWFWPVLLPMVLLLFVAIGRRISDYGITEPRFMVAHAGVWLLVVGLYFVISQRDNIKFIPLSLAAFTLVAIVGPFNAFNVSQRNQTSELQRLLEANGRLLEGKTTVSQRTVSDQDAARIESCLKFLEDRDALYRITPWFSKPLDSLPEISPGEDMSTRIMAHLNIQKDQILEASAVYVSPNTPVRFGNIRGFTTYYTLDLYENNEEPPGVGNFVAITPDGHGIAWREKRGTKETDLEVFDLQATLDSCMKNSENGSYFFAKGDETIDFYGKRAEMRLVISDMSLVKREGHATIRSLRGMLYLKDKIK